MQNSEILKSTRAALENKWTLSVITYFVYCLIIGAPSSWPPLRWVNLLIGGPMAYGATVFSLNIIRGKEAELEQIFLGFRQ